MADERSSRWRGPGASDEVVTVTVTCLSDGRAHVVPDTSMVNGAARGGCYEAMCGHLVTAAPMVEPDGKPCAQCSALTQGARPTPSRRGGLRLLGGGRAAGSPA